MAKRITDTYRRLVRDETILDPGGAPLAKGDRPLAVLAYPNSYRTGMASLGFHAVFGLLRRHLPGPVDRAFLPDPETREGLLRSRIPLPALESGAPLSAARLLAFSVSYEPDYLGVVRMLALAGIPLLGVERGDRDPLVAVGGLAPAMNPEPLAPIADVILIGDAEPLVPEAARALDGGWGLGRVAMMERLAAVPGVYVPSLAAGDPVPGDRVVARRSAAELGRERVPAVSFAITPHAEFGRMLLVETGRGCPWNCRFCLVGCGLGRPAWTPAAGVCGAVRAAAGTGWTRAGLVASSAADHPELDEICRLSLEDGLPISLPSLRAASSGERLLRALAASGQRSLTIAPEAGTERLRALVGKREAEADYFDFLVRAVRVGAGTFRRLKLYFMLGLPWETDDDAIEAARLAAEMALAAARDAVGLSVTASFKPFVPRPQTPLQWAPMETTKALKARARLIQREARRRGRTNLRVQAGGAGPAQVQGMLALGGREMARVIIAAHANGGSWRTAAREEGIDLDRLLHRTRPPQTVFPWEAVIGAAGRDGLLAGYRKAARQASRGDEGPPGAGEDGRTDAGPPERKEVAAS